MFSENLNQISPSLKFLHSLCPRVQPSSAQIARVSAPTARPANTLGLPCWEREAMNLFFILTVSYGMKRMKRRITFFSFLISIYQIMAQRTTHGILSLKTLH